MCSPAANIGGGAPALALADSARLFALLSLGLANSFIVDWEAKFHYNFWRPDRQRQRRAQAHAQLRQSVAALADEQRNVRVWGGIHFRSSLEVSERMGRALVEQVVQTTYTPAR
jgi:hypothetical protein